MNPFSVNEHLPFSRKMLEGFLSNFVVFSYIDLIPYNSK